MTPIVWGSPFDLSQEEMFFDKESFEEDLLDPLDAFIKGKEAIIQILDIRQGKKFALHFKEGQEKSYKNLLIKVNKIWLEKESYYKKIILAEITINFSDYKVSSLTPKLVENNYLIGISCK
jgi:hypothetical protein